METISLTILSYSAQETIKFGQKLGSLLEEGDVVALSGELGSGKTWLTKGLAIGLGVSPETVVTSPSFALVNEYEGRTVFFHMDVYRLEGLSDFFSSGLEEYLCSGGVVAMEWADRWIEILPAHRVKVALGIVDENQREIALSGDHPRAAEIIESLKKEVNKG